MKASDIIYTDGKNTCASAPVFSNIDGNVKYIRADLAEQPELPSDIDKAAEDSWAEYEYRESPRGLYSTCYVDGFKAGAEWQREQYECIPTEEAYMRGFAQGAKEEREGLSPTMLTYAADVFGGKMLPEDISYSYRQELADYFRDLAKMAKATNARKEESK